MAKLQPLLPANLAPGANFKMQPAVPTAPHVHRGSIRRSLKKPTATHVLLVHTTVKLQPPLPANLAPGANIKMHPAVPIANCAHPGEP